MGISSRVFLSFVIVISGSIVTPVLAQESPWSVGVSGVAVQYDLSGTGTAPGIAVRAARPVHGNMVLELRGVFARPDQQFGSSTFFAPDVHVHYRWNIARFSPYVGGGAGIAATTFPLRTEWDPTLSFAAGTGVRLGKKLDLIAELRLRAIEWPATGSTAEWSAGLAWRLPEF